MLRRVSSFLLFALFLASPCWAQLASQTALVGTVTDSAGLVLPGAAVVAVNTGTKDTYEATTNSEGYYHIQFVRTGKYDISVTVSGFQTFRASGVEVANNQVVRTNATLQVGGINETVTVESTAQVLNTDSATVSETIGERAIVDLPVIGRNVWTLASTTPGVLSGNSSDIGLSFRGAGQREIQNSLSLDGINASSNLLAATSMRPIADAVTEVQVQTGSTSAEYGSYLGVHINIVTKSGTNTPHGSFFNFFQDDALDARGYFENRANPPAPRRRNQFGGQMDGPVLIPGLYDGRNRTFFMGAYEGIRAETTSSQIISVPTALMRQGNFSEVSTLIRLPGTGPGTPNPAQFFPGNIIPGSMLSSIALRVLDHFPMPNLTGTASNYRGDAFSTDRTNQLLMRVDQNLGNKVRLNVRYNWHDNTTINGSAIPIQGLSQPRVNHNTLVSYTHTLKPTLHNDFRIGSHRLDFDTLNYFGYSNVPSAGAELGIPGFDGDVRYKNPGVPNISISAFSGLGQGGTNWYQFDTTFQMSNVLAYTRGSHNVRAGFDVRRLATGRRAANSPRGAFNFNGDITGYAMADFMLGLPRSVTTPVDQIQGHVGGWRNGFFVNDVWQATRDLTLSLGLRYERNTPVQTYTGFAAMLNAEQTGIIPTSFPTKGFQFHEPNSKDIAPRIGATYRLTEKTVVRAGFGIYFNPNQMNTFTFLTNNPPLAAEFTFNSNPANPTLSFSSPFGVVGPGGPPNVTTPNRHLPNARKDQWSFDIQRELWRGGALDLQYVGSNTENLDRSFFNNTPAPGPGDIDPRRPNQSFRVLRIIQNDLVADYDAVSVILRQRMIKGLQGDAHYTWSRTRDMSTHSNGGGTTMDNYDIWRDYGPANWDIPHRVVASYIYDVPFLRSSPNTFLRSVVGGWQVGGITVYESGSPLNVTIQGDRANTGTGGQRADLVGSIPKRNCQPHPTGLGLVNCFDASAFAVPALFTFGSAPRNALRGPNSIVTDLSLSKNFALGGPARFQFRVELFNAFNTVNWGSPNTQVGNANFGRITSAGSMRRLELGGKFLF